MNFLIEFDYVAEEDDELSVQKGDIVNDVKLYEDGWMIGTFKGKKGVFPSNFGKQISTENNKIHNVKSNSGSVSNDTEEEIHKEIISEEPKAQTKKVMGVGFGDIFSGRQIQLKHAVVSEPKIQQVEEELKPETHFEKKTGVVSSHKAELVKASYPYKAENPDELEIEEGDIITILDKKNTDEGWWKGKLNGKVGVFPNNFVVPVTSEDIGIDDKMDSIKVTSKLEHTAKSSRPTVVNKTPPPLPLTAKPIANKPKMAAAPIRPPSAPESVKLAPKQSVKTPEPEYEEINFETPSNHKPLVGPTADRVRRQNIRPPKKNLEVNNNTEENPVTPEVMKNTTPRERSVDPLSSDSSNIKSSVILKPPVTREKSNDNSLTDPKLATTHKTAALKERFSENPTPQEPVTKHVSVRERSRELADSAEVSRKSRLIPDKSKESPAPAASEVSDSKINLRPKSQLFGGSHQTENDNLKMLKSDDSDALKKKVSVLESKISAIEDDNALLRREMEEMAKNNNEEITNLTNIVNKLLADFEVEKTKRKSGDMKLSQLKEIIDDLDLSQN